MTIPTASPLLRTTPRPRPSCPGSSRVRPSRLARHARDWAASLALALAPVGAVALVLAAGSAPAHAQVVIRVGGGGGGTTPIAKRSVDDYAKLLGLTEDQADTARTLHEGYRQAFREAQQAHEAVVESFQDRLRDGEREDGEAELGKAMRAFGEKGTALEKSFMSDLKQVLTPEQQEKWPAVERHRRRETGLRFGFYSGGAVDLIKVAGNLGPQASTPELSATLAQYEGDIDRLIQEMRRRSESLRSLDDQKGFDPKQQEQLREQLGEVSKQIRDLNIDYAKRISSQLPEGDRPRFDRAVASRMFGEVYKPSHTEDVLDAAKGFSDLESSQRDAIESLRTQYDRDAAKINREWADAIVKAEEGAGGSIGLMMRQWGPDGGAQPDAALRDARKARRDLDQKVKSRLEELLRPEQKERLPEKKKSEGEGGPFNIRVDLGHDEEKDEG
jgi:Spy/CpxP family protein refolding chaperone